MTAQSIFGIVQGYGVRLGVGIAPHDLRRTFAKLAHSLRGADTLIARDQWDLVSQTGCGDDLLPSHDREGVGLPEPFSSSC